MTVHIFVNEEFSRAAQYAIIESLGKSYERFPSSTGRRISEISDIDVFPVIFNGITGDIFVIPMNPIAWLKRGIPESSLSLVQTIPEVSHCSYVPANYKRNGDGKLIGFEMQESMLPSPEELIFWQNMRKLDHNPQAFIENSGIPIEGDYFMKFSVTSNYHQHRGYVRDLNHRFKDLSDPEKAAEYERLLSKEKEFFERMRADGRILKHQKPAWES